eukprot:CAMPEP_0183790022 /NCGR_PEP_ID=MMETSP0803_2-20130417/766_1 /TAXON_ID=195967 /ORGANISM="Crustomastix stigmata, Strain CCMP3273" /LENGTH=408 /DNA_ID=CAMNT_0026034213 /DNA_START=378 /DNA_END=1605 /DNA_ORIENTATION=-
MSVSKLAFVNEQEQLSTHIEPEIALKGLLELIFGSEAVVYNTMFEFGSLRELFSGPFRMNFMRTTMPDHIVHSIYQSQPSMYRGAYGVYSTASTKPERFTSVVGLIDPIEGQYSFENMNTTSMVQANEIWQVKTISAGFETTSRRLLEDILIFGICKYLQVFIKLTVKYFRFNYASLTFKLLYFCDHCFPRYVDDLARIMGFGAVEAGYGTNSIEFKPGSGWMQISHTEKKGCPLIVSFSCGGLASVTSGGTSLGEMKAMLASFEYECNFFAARDLSQSYYFAGIPKVGRSLLEIATHIERLRDSYSSSQVILLGHCRGGYASLILASMTPVASLYLFNPTTFILPEHYAYADIKKNHKGNNLPTAINLKFKEETNIHLYYSTDENNVHDHKATIQQFVDELKEAKLF